jgi:hypothetical protein
MMTIRIEGNRSSQGKGIVDAGSVSLVRTTQVTPTSANDHQTLSLPEPLQSLANGGDLLAELTSLLTLASQNDRELARKAERVEDMVRTQQEHLKVQHMHQQADDIRLGAWAEGLAEIGQGICQVGAGTIKCRPGELDWNDMSLAVNKGFAAGGTTVSGHYKASEKLAQADAEEAGANADRAGRGSKEAAEDVQNAHDMLKRIASFYEQMLQAQSASMGAAANWRA